MAREPERAEAGCRRRCTQYDRAGQAGLEEIVASRPPRHHEIDVERDPDSQEQGKHDDVRKVQ